MSEPPSSARAPKDEPMDLDLPLEPKVEVQDTQPTKYAPEMQVAEATEWLSTPLGEIAFFKAACQARPVGAHRYFHVLSMRTRIASETGAVVPIQAIWDKLEKSYGLSKLEEKEPMGFPTESPPPSPHVRERAGEREIIEEPTWTDPDSYNIRTHPFFNEEFTLPSQVYDVVMERVMRGKDDPPSPPDSPTTSAAPASKRGKMTSKAATGKKRARTSKAGAGHSELSDPEEDEPERAQSIMTGTGTADSQDEEEASDEDAEEEDGSATPASIRGRGRGRPRLSKSAPSSSTRGKQASTKRRKKYASHSRMNLNS
ncbi:hypothetical protein BKA62DRAFT_696753 [Auriculariales sp. MPI-PUGE-AT-0066]|nr:hypothetical protein BKA62DRAFT_696753 [Auriculariales sp. MPI-PUGE-AT-0066]